MKRNENELKAIREFKTNPTGQDIVKYKLWQEQQNICIYSGKNISIQDLFTEAVDVDHIIPYSMCFDDSYNNKVLVLASENRQKGNRV
ncbi:type II CRISPR RNA-guided endonuclease Cas9, partial [Klebsiella pneumoniae]|uniref:type II CRISPR RNA-guided endonuclease Cas9 n=1 Tax=Klebsiella pneumoniae TaxID=573 RepID=UPI003AF72349